MAAGTADDVDRAVAAARRAFEAGWAFTPPAERADWLRKLADGLETRKQDIASIISQEVGMPISMSLPHPGGHAGRRVAQLRRSGDVLALRKKYRSFADPA